LSRGDVIAINYNKKIYELNVLETKPANAVSIIECDMNVEFEAPPGYVVRSMACSMVKRSGTAVYL
jgi:ubiquitin fusion degradation protein 1